MHRWVSIWFPFWKTDEVSRRFPKTVGQPLVVYVRQKGRMVVSACNRVAQDQGVQVGMVLADARARVDGLQVMVDQPETFQQILHQLARWCIRFSPVVALDAPDGIWIQAGGCAHLWGGEQPYLQSIQQSLRCFGYHARIAMADSTGAAWAMSRYGHQSLEIIPSGASFQALGPLPPVALRLEASMVQKLEKLGIQTIEALLKMPGSSLKRRFGPEALQSIQYAFGTAQEAFVPIDLPVEWTERLPCLEPIQQAAGVEWALQHLLGCLTERLRSEEKGLRKVQLHAYRVDQQVETLEVQVQRPTAQASYLAALFALKIPQLRPGPGIEVFVLDAFMVEPIKPDQELIWEQPTAVGESNLSLLVDRLCNQIGAERVYRYRVGQTYWPEYCLERVGMDKQVTEINKRSLSAATFPALEGKTRPAHLLEHPEPIQVAAPVPDYPPLLFRHREVVHTIRKADGPERLEQPWWIQDGQHRDYFYVEDEEGRRYWIFRLGDYRTGTWYLHGYCV